MPRYKVRGVGDRVASDDQVVLVGVRRPLRLHVSPSALTDGGDQLWEITASQV
jgi:hypothetical protein